MKHLILTRGLPGSGKSTIAKNMVEQALSEGKTALICSTDDFFMVNGVYVFDMNKLGKNHQLNQEKAAYYIECGTDIVVVDNTNVCAKEIFPYASVALLHDYAVKMVEPNTPWAWDINILLQKNTHNVPRTSYERMLAKWEETDDVGETLAKQLNCSYDIINQTLYKELP